MPDELSQEQTGLAGLWSLRSRLEGALATCWQRAIARHHGSDLLELQNQIGLRRVDAPTGVVYSSAIAPRLAANLGTTTEEIAELLAHSWQRSAEAEADWKAGLTDSLLTVTQRHLIQIRLGDRLLAAWLQQFANSASSSAPSLPVVPAPFTTASTTVATALQTSPLPPSHQIQDRYFEIQAAHARCCTLLALAERVDLVRFEAAGTTHRALVWPALLPWLEANGTLRTQQPAEQRLIWQVIDSVDALDQTLRKDAVYSAIALAQALSRSVADFDTSCRIFGEVAGCQPELAQARLGLVRAAQQTLRWLLEGQLRVAAPVSL